MYDVDTIRQDFPILHTEVQGKPLVYLDNGASAQKPRIVIDAVSDLYAAGYANVHRGLHFLSGQITDRYEQARSTIAHFLNAPEDKEIVFTSGTTEGINLVAYAWAMPRFRAGDEIVLSVMEHHANIVPWHFLREQCGCVLRWVDIDAEGNLPVDAVLEAITPRTRLIALTHMSNVLGTIVDVAAITQAAHARGIPVLVDGSQAAVHMPVDVQAIGCDFYAITGHKLYGPSGSGAIYIKQQHMQTMRPFMGGGDMIRDVHKDNITWADPPHKFEAGTPAIVQQIGLAVALDYMLALGRDAIAQYERTITNYALAELSALDFITLQGRANTRGGIFSFTMKSAANASEQGYAFDMATILDKQGIAVRSGQHCAGVLMDALGLPSSCRASLGLYNTRSDVDRFVEGLQLCRDLLL